MSPTCGRVTERPELTLRMGHSAHVHGRRGVWCMVRCARLAEGDRGVSGIFLEHYGMNRHQLEYEMASLAAEGQVVRAEQGSAAA